MTQGKFILLNTGKFAIDQTTGRFLVRRAAACTECTVCTPWAVRATVSGVQFCPDCYPRDDAPPNASIKWITTPSPDPNRAYTLQQDPGDPCRWASDAQAVTTPGVVKTYDGLVCAGAVLATLTFDRTAAVVTITAGQVAFYVVLFSTTNAYNIMLFESSDAVADPCILGTFNSDLAGCGWLPGNPRIWDRAAFGGAVTIEGICY